MTNPILPSPGVGGAAPDPLARPAKPVSARRAAVLFIFFLALMTLFAQHNQRLLVWLTAVIAFFACVGVGGHSVSGRWLGALIDERNVMSLSRFQLVAWMALVLTTFLAVAWLR